MELVEVPAVPVGNRQAFVSAILRQNWRRFVGRRSTVELRIEEFCHGRIFVGDSDRLLKASGAQPGQRLFEEPRAEAAVTIFH